MSTYDPSKRKAFKSTTFWFSLTAIIINPISWIMDYMFKKNILNLVIENKDKITPAEAANFIVNIPLPTIATLAVMAISFYTLKRGADKAIGQLTESATKDLTSKGNLSTVLKEIKDSLSPSANTETLKENSATPTNSDK